MYVVARDFGFAPNPFHGVCTLATCKPLIRRKAQIGDWVIGMGGARLKAVGRCVFAMKITDTMSFDKFWANPEFRAKRPVRNGSRKMMVRDNIYHHNEATSKWEQADSHHSRPDGTPDLANQERDTSADRVIISQHFLYFGSCAPLVPAAILNAIGFRNGQGHRLYDDNRCRDLLGWLKKSFHRDFNRILGDPYDFSHSNARYSVHNDKVT